MKTLLLTGSRVILSEREVVDADVLIEGEKISRVLPDRSRVNAEEVVDISGATLFPGFIDAHIHGSVGADVMDARASDLQRVAAFLVSQGVTSWVPTLVPAPDKDYSSAVKAIAESMRTSNADGARVLGVHYEGPFVNVAQCGALRKEYFKTFASASDVETLPTPDIEGARLITLAPEVAGGIELITELVARGWIVAIGHTRAEHAKLDEALAAGAHHMTHFMNAMAPLHHRNPGPIAWGLLHDDVTCDVIADGIHLDRFMLQLLLKVKGSRRMILISDAIAAAGMGDGQYQIWGETITVENGRTRNTAGSIAGSAISMLDAVRIMRTLRVPDVEIAQMAATNPARLLNINHDCGSIEEGKRADLVALDAESNVRLTIVSGRVVFQS